MLISREAISTGSWRARIDQRRLPMAIGTSKWSEANGSQSPGGVFGRLEAGFEGAGDGDGLDLAGFGGAGKNEPNWAIDDPSCATRSEADSPAGTAVDSRLSWRNSFIVR
jgi:hypothetical protein